jgi:glycerate-2-kinase
MSIIQSEHKAHRATCDLSEGTRQNDVAQAILAGGGSAVVAAAVRAAEIAHYRRIIASCLANGLPSAQFGQALRDLGTA